jgi:hypothetical protein
MKGWFINALIYSPETKETLEYKMRTKFTQ